jgi:2-succinyl-5-enolpyruvyl-6-hydroxy-3-cyclohexene-1-carboxylate synthase
MGAMTVTPAATFCATLVDTWIRNGVRHAVVAPGSRSTPMALALAARDELALHVFHDERSASFAAVGIGRATGAPALLLCTSGTAAAEFHAAVVEAHQDDVPMIVLTADRPPELRDVGAAQTIDQTRLFGPAVRWFADPGVPDMASAHTWRALANRAWETSTGMSPGPVHLNLPFREPLVGDAAPLPPVLDYMTVRSKAILGETDLAALAQRLDTHRGVIVAGLGSHPAVLELAADLGWPVLADQRSGIRANHPNVIAAFDDVLRHPRFASDHTPEIVLHIGKPLSSKVTTQWLAASGAFHIQVHETSAWIDPDHQVGWRIQADVELLAQALIGRSTGAKNTPWLTRWRRSGERASGAVDLVLGEHKGLSEPQIARDLVAALPDGAALVVSSSMPIRDVEWFAEPRDGIQVFANRGANGIDGVTSTAVGVALADPSRPVALLIGDVAFLHDTNGLLGLLQRDANLTIVVIDNDGGGIFSFLPQRAELPVERFEKLFGTPHGVSIAGLAGVHGVPVWTVEEQADVAPAVLRATQTPGPVLLHLRTTRDANVAVHDLIHRAVAMVLDQR